MLTKSCYATSDPGVGVPAVGPLPVAPVEARPLRRLEVLSNADATVWSSSVKGARAVAASATAAVADTFGVGARSRVGGGRVRSAATSAATPFHNPARGRCRGGSTLLQARCRPGP